MTEQPEERALASPAAKGFAIGALAVGIGALVLSVIPPVGALAIYPGLAAVVVSTVGLVVPLANKSKLSGLLIAVLGAALVVALFSVVIGAFWLHSQKEQKEAEPAPFIHTLF